MRRIAYVLVAIAALTTLVACKSSTSGAKKTATPQQTVAATSTSAATSAATPTPGNVPMSFADSCQKSDEKSWSSAPAQIIDTSKTYVATIKTDKGDIVVELYSDVPITTNNFVFLACSGFYDGLTFHRVVPDFVIQGGDPTGSGAGGPGYAIPDEPDGDHKMDVGVISMANAGPNTAGSQFFITIGLGQSGSLAYLDDAFPVFGKVTAGQDVAGQIAQGDTITTVTIQEQ
jgi:cyclophilin family peptidyl-prolyl cis-trans isomerase